MSTSREVGVEPFDVKNLRLNIIGEGSWGSSGEFITWEVEVPEAGYYYLAFKVKQATENTTSYRTLYVNGEIPFEEAKHLPFSYTSEWKNVPIQGVDGTRMSALVCPTGGINGWEVANIDFYGNSGRGIDIRSGGEGLSVNNCKFTNANIIKNS